MNSQRRIEILTKGPARVITTPEGDATNLSRALAAQISIDIVFVRKDGWSLGANNKLEAAAYELWPDEWEAFMRFPLWDWQPINQYKGFKSHV